MPWACWTIPFRLPHNGNLNKAPTRAISQLFQNIASKTERAGRLLCLPVYGVLCTSGLFGIPQPHPTRLSIVCSPLVNRCATRPPSDANAVASRSFASTRCCQSWQGGAAPGVRVRLSSPPTVLLHGDERGSGEEALHESKRSRARERRMRPPRGLWVRLGACIFEMLHLYLTQPSQPMGSAGSTPAVLMASSTPHLRKLHSSNPIRSPRVRANT
ncbi:hypothetical protein N658DRAFT_68354 [Parathielavia hyrcaniae]|uniref:Uncharacterized protein n=1 Tax=Parathielavia hyrcaniae TaxID=113614 RepID=A0AAN6Q5K2_9PEZI|nr:hypothetical protein N658DRAFT_68354 [Parathielavia hyrcaniae]